jgi:hypothetical protein
MQKSAHPSRQGNPAQTEPAEPADSQSDKGQKFEPFFIPAIGRDRRSMARQLRLDQRR